MKSIHQFFEDIASRRAILKQRSLKQAADFKDRTTGARQRAKEDAKKKADYKAKIRAEVEKEIADES